MVLCGEITPKTHVNYKHLFIAIKNNMHFYKPLQARFILIFCCSAFLIPAKLCGQLFTTIRTHEGVEILENGKKVLFYQQQPKSLDGKYARAGYVHPLYNLHENVLTEDSPEDHPYHRGIFWAWHQIILKKKKIADGWVSENISWEPVSLKIIKKEASIRLQSEMLWNCVLKENKPTAIVKENTTIRIYKSTARYRAIDFDIHLVALVDSLEIGGSDDAKGYGGFCIRLKLPTDISFLSNDSTVTPTETAVTAGPWMDFRGSFDNETLSKTGVAIFCNPSNSHLPQQWILRKEASMQNIPYPGRTPVPLTKRGWHITCRIIIHNDMSNDDLEKLYQRYIHKL
jgi:Methane oxygenase PmoA